MLAQNSEYKAAINNFYIIAYHNSMWIFQVAVRCVNHRRYNVLELHGMESAS